MSKLSYFIVALVLAAAQAFAPVMPKTNSAAIAQPTVMNMAEDMYWENEYPPSKVLGPVLSKMPSGLLGVSSLVLLAITVVSCANSAVLLNVPGAVETGNWVKWYNVLGSFMGPIAWGCHVACWIQRKNGM